MRLWISVTACCLLALSTSLKAQAQLGANLTDPASELLQDSLRRIDEIAPDPRPQPSSRTPPASRPVAPQTTGRISVAEIQFSASELLTSDELRAVGQRYVGRTLSSADIQALLEDISNLYRRQGILTAVPVLPPQDLRGGVLRILLVEGRLGKVQVRKPGSARPLWVQSWFNLPQNQVVDEAMLTEALQRFNLTSDFNASASFVAGERFGYSDLLIDIAETEPIQRWAFYETATQGALKGQGQWAVGLRISPATSLGGRLDTAILKSEGGATLTGSFSMPIETSGWRIGVTASTARSKTTVPSDNPDNDDLHIDGQADSMHLELSRSWFLPASWVLGTTIGFGQQKSSTGIKDSTPLFIFRVSRGILTSTLSRESEVSKSSLKLSLTTALSQSVLDYSRSSYQFVDAAASHLTVIDTDKKWIGRLNLAWRGVISGQPGASDRFQIGGYDSVRGFDSGDASGYEGVSLQIEMRHRLSRWTWLPQAELYSFLGSGYAELNGQKQSLKSIGVGLQAQINRRLGLDAIWSHGRTDRLAGFNRLGVRFIASW